MTGAEHELSITRLIDAPRNAVWDAWTKRTAEWFAPRPWEAEIVEQDLRPGGRSAIVMRGPGGEEMPAEGVFLEVVPGERIVSTDALKAGWIPQGPFMVAITTFAQEGDKTRYTATARHWTAEAMQQHEDMGFTQGWTIVAGQLAAIAEGGANA